MQLRSDIPQDVNLLGGHQAAFEKNAGGGFIGIQCVCSDHLETGSQQPFRFKQSQDAADHPRHAGNASRLAKPSLFLQAALQLAKAFHNALFVLVEFPIDRIPLGRSQSEAFAIPSTIHRPEQVFPTFDLFPVHTSPIGPAFDGGFHIGAMELSGVDENPALIPGHLNPTKAFFHLNTMLRSWRARRMTCSKTERS